jgi:PAS domain S-box-containing protein
VYWIGSSTVSTGQILSPGIALGSGMVTLAIASLWLWRTLAKSRKEIERRDQALRNEIARRNEIERLLGSTETQFRHIFMSTPIPVWLYDLQTGTFLEVNDNAVEKYGYTRDEFLRMSIDDVQPCEDHQADKVRKAIFSQGQTSLCCHHKRKDGRAMDVEINSHRITLGNRPAVLMASLNISDRKQMEVELRHAQKLEAVGALAAGIAHEINTPIQFIGDNTRFLQTAFKGARQLLDRYQEICEEARQGTASEELIRRAEAARIEADWEYAREEVPKAIDHALQGIERVAKIVRAMKEFSHVNQCLEKTAADINRAVESTLIVARNELKYVAEVQTRYGDLPPVICHLGDLNQVFLNLLINAAHAIGDVVRGTGTKGRIGVRTSQVGDWVEIAISDTGTGIPEVIQDKIFDPFFTTKEIGKGTGQGLALARAVVVEKHGGTLTFETESGKGTTFYVRLPMIRLGMAQEALAETVQRNG